MFSHTASRLFTALLLVLAGFILPNGAQAATGSVTISTDTTWSDASQDYTFDTITVADGAKLTIGPGVKVTLTGQGGNFRLRGTLVIQGTSQQRATLECRFGTGPVFDALTGQAAVTIDYATVEDCQRMGSAPVSISHSLLLSGAREPCISGYALFTGIGQFSDNVFLNWNLQPANGSEFRRNLFVGDSCINGAALVQDNYFDTNELFWTLWGSARSPCQLDAANNYWGSINEDLAAIEAKIIDSEDTYNIECDVDPSPVSLTAPSVPVYTPGSTASVTTGSSSAVSTSEATLHATINHDWAQDLEYGVEYSTMDDFAVSETSYVPRYPDEYRGDEEQPFSLTLSNLDPASTYYYRVIAHTDADSLHHWGQTINLTGQTGSFVTLGAKPTISETNVAAGTDRADFSGTFNANHLSTTVQVELSLTADFTTATRSTPQKLDGDQDTFLTTSLAGLLPGTAYHYRYKAVNQAGTTYGPMATFATMGRRPSVTTGDALPSSRSAQVMASVNANDLPTTVSIEYGLINDLSSGTNRAGVRQVDGNQIENVTVLLDGLTPDTRYYYRVRGENSLGDNFGEIRSFTTPPDACAIDGNIGVSINDGNPYTNSREVELQILMPKCATSIRVSNDGGFGNTTSFPPQPSVRWRLDDTVQGKYTKLVYVRFSGAGVNEAQTFADDIILDTEAPVITSLAASPTSRAKTATAAVAASSRRVSLSCKARDDRSGVRRLQVNTSKRAKGAITSNYRKRLKVAIPGAIRGNAVFVRVRDGAGNWSKWKRAAVHQGS